MITKLLPSLFAIVGLVTLGCVALSYGVDGAIFVTCLAGVAGLGGYSINRSSKIDDF